MKKRCWLVSFILSHVFAFADFSPSIIAQLDAAFDEAFSVFPIIGCTAAVWVPGQDGTWAKTRGVANINAGRPLLYNDVTPIGSITKSFTGIVILQLVDENLLTLDESITRFNLNIPNSDNITVRMLLNHTSGLFDYLQNPAVLQRLDEDDKQYFSPQELIAYAVAEPPLFAPGTAVSYSNTNFVALGIIAEQLTGNSIGDEIQTRITIPLQLQYTYLPTTVFPKGEYTHGYTTDGVLLKDFTYFSPSVTWASGGIFSNLRDLKTWVEALGTGALISPETFAQQLIIVPPPPFFGPAEPFAGSGLGVLVLGPFIGHTGGTQAVSAAAYYYPAQEATIVVIFNEFYVIHPNLADYLFFKLSKVVFPNDVPW